MNVESLPPFTTAWAVGAVALAMLDKMGFVSRYQLFYSNSLALHKGQYWRLFTTFAYFGTFDIVTVFQMLFSMRYAYLLEVQTYGVSGRANFTWLLLLLATALLTIQSFVGVQFLAESFAFALMYIWCRKNRHVPIQFFGLFAVGAPYQPYLVTCLNWALSGFSGKMRREATGLALGHLFYFLLDVWPREWEANHTKLLRPPLLWYVCLLTQGGGYGIAAHRGVPSILAWVAVIY